MNTDMEEGGGVGGGGEDTFQVAYIVAHIYQILYYSVLRV